MEHDVVVFEATTAGGLLPATGHASAFLLSEDVDVDV
jgi:hypothetical protein